jgi:hypothetical protein
MAHCARCDATLTLIAGHPTGIKGMRGGTGLASIAAAALMDDLDKVIEEALQRRLGCLPRPLSACGAPPILLAAPRKKKP